ncbi:PREDICTED: ubiquitin-like protein 4A-like [Elephantulus edwardii]|uniref:ubiquitin-like protein 4A-like n=1 Tax=Elephantulus edwardii TaxID=28737 RepID=UPI0003F09408|nr:PREDICTED: ubiquitin-like protein 4A-like [Elephantulus edwardii]
MAPGVLKLMPIQLMHLNGTSGGSHGLPEKDLVDVLIRQKLQVRKIDNQLSWDIQHWKPTGRTEACLRDLKQSPCHGETLTQDAQPRPLAPTSETWQVIAKILGRHFSAADATRVQEQLQREYERSLSRLTMDDIERLASRFLHPEVTEATEKGLSK